MPIPQNEDGSADSGQASKGLLGELLGWKVEFGHGSISLASDMLNHQYALVLA